MILQRYKKKNWIRRNWNEKIYSYKQKKWRGTKVKAEREIEKGTHVERNEEEKTSKLKDKQKKYDTWKKTSEVDI